MRFSIRTPHRADQYGRGRNADDDRADQPGARLPRDQARAECERTQHVAELAHLAQADPKFNGTRLDGFVAGDHEESKKKALDFVQSVGFRPVDAGPLAMARALESMALLNIMLQIRNKWP